MFDDLSVEQLYSVIAYETMPNLPDGWQEAEVVSEIEEDDNGLTYSSFIDEHGETKWIDFESAHRIYYAFDQIREIVHKLGESKWIKAVFTLQNTGQFTLNFTYPESNESLGE